MEISIQIKGEMPKDMLGSINALLKDLGGSLPKTNVTATATEVVKAPKKTTKAAAAPAVVEEAAEEIDNFGEETTDDGEELGFDAPAEEPAPAKAKAAKLTEKDVNEACKAYARAHGRPATLKILKGKFNAESIVEIKAENYAKVIAALKV